MYSLKSEDKVTSAVVLLKDYGSGRRRFHGSALGFVDLRRADLSRTDLRDADLSYASLQQANLSFANLRGANLQGADLTGANLCGADLSSAKFSHTKLTGALCNDLTYFPPGFAVCLLRLIYSSPAPHP